MNRSYSKIRHIQEANHRLEKRLVENVIAEEEEIDEANPITGLVKSASKKIGQYVDDAVNYFKKPDKTPKYFDEIPGYNKNRPAIINQSVPPSNLPSLGNALSKYGEQTWDQALNSALKPVRDEVVVLTNDLRRLTPQVQDKELLKSIEIMLEDLTDSNLVGSLKMSKGRYSFTETFNSLGYLTTLIDDLIATQKVNPEGVKILQYMKGNVNDAYQKLQTAFIDTLRK
jgi:hypothetical protein